MVADADTPKIDLSAGLVTPKKATAPKNKKITPKINLSAGLVPKGKKAAPAMDRTAGIQPPPPSSSTDTSSVASSPERGRSSASAVSASAEQVSQKNIAEKQIELPATTPPVFVVDEAVSPVTPKLPTAPPSPPPVQPRVPGVFRTGEFTRPEPPQRGKVREPQPTAPQSAPVAPRSSPETHPVEYWEHISNRLDDFQPEIAPEAVHEPEPEETPNNAATRMSGLRNLIFTLGLKNLNKEAKPGDEAAESAPQPGRGTERQVNVRSFTPAPAQPGPSRSSVSSASPTLVTAQPEILPPEPSTEKMDKERSWKSKSVARHDRRDAFDDVEILPSWRGQYRKK
jgi:hypothetical protein